jgi:hypothetical protein
MDANLRDPRTLVWLPAAPLLFIWVAARMAYYQARLRRWK